MKAKIFILSLLAILFCCVSCDNSEKLQKIAAENAAMLGDYLPYTHNDSLVFINNDGKEDILLIDYDRIPKAYYTNGTLNGFRVNSFDDGWISWAHMSFVYHTQGEFFCSLATGEGNKKEYIIIASARIKPSLTSHKRYNFSATGGIFSVEDELPDTLRFQGDSNSDSPNGYVILIRHKGLVEYSFDGQEIWRLVEE